MRDSIEEEKKMAENYELAMGKLFTKRKINGKERKLLAIPIPPYREL